MIWFKFLSILCYFAHIRQIYICKRLAYIGENIIIMRRAYTSTFMHGKLICCANTQKYFPNNFIWLHIFKSILLFKLKLANIKVVCELCISKSLCHHCSIGVPSIYIYTMRRMSTSRRSNRVEAYRYNSLLVLYHKRTTWTNILQHFPAYLAYIIFLQLKKIESKFDKNIIILPKVIFITIWEFIYFFAE